MDEKPGSFTGPVHWFADSGGAGMRPDGEGPALPLGAAVHRHEGRLHRRPALRRHARCRAMWVESTARWLEFDLSRFQAMWREGRLLSEDPLDRTEQASSPTRDDLLRAALRLHEDTAELVRHLQRSDTHH